MVQSAAKLTLTETEEDLIGEDIQGQKPKPLGSITASAARLTKKKLKRMGHRAKAGAWQEDAWDMLDLVGEERFLATTLANRMSQARFFTGRLGADTTEDLEKIEEGPAYDAFQPLAKAKSALGNMVQRLGVNLFIPGDGYIMGVPKDYDPKAAKVVQTQAISPFGEVTETDPLASIDLDTLEWSTYSTSELQVDDNTGDITVKRMGTHEYDADSVVLIRIWRSHPRFWEQSDSPTRSSLPVLRELVGLTMHISAQIDSRLAGAGMLLIPASADQAVRAAAGSSLDSDASPLADAVQEAMVTPISDRSNASAVVPIMPVVPDESIEKFRFISFSTPLDKEAKNLRDEAIRRLALGQDCPPELLLGVAGMNHWGAWLVREDVVVTHLEPPLALICDALTREYLWPVLEQQGVEDYERYVIWYDVEHLIQRPNRSQDAKDARTLGVISDKATRDALGFDETDAPDIEPQDPVIALIIQMLKEAPTLAVNPGLGVLAEQVRQVLEGLTPAAPDDTGDDAGEEQPTDDVGGAAEEGPPATQDAPPEEPA